MWLWKDNILEVGTSNIFIYWKNSDGELEVVTPDLTNLILPGVTRDSVLALLREKKGLKVTERPLKLPELQAALRERRLKEIFTCGTAVTVASVDRIHIKGSDYEVPINKNLGAGELAYDLYKQLFDIYYGKVEHPWSVIVH